MKKAGILDGKKERYGCTVKNKHRKLKTKEIAEIKAIKSMLLKKYDLKTDDLKKKRMDKVKKYNKELKKELSEKLDIKYDYDVFSYKVVDMEKLEEADIIHDLEDHLYDGMVKGYKKLHGEHSLKLAKGRNKRMNKCNEDRFEDSLNFLKSIDEYSIAWNSLLNYFDSPSEPIILEEETTEAVQKHNPIAHFQDIRIITELGLTSKSENTTDFTDEVLLELTGLSQGSNIEEDFEMLEESMSIPEEDWMKELGII